MSDENRKETRAASEESRAKTLPSAETNREQGGGEGVGGGGRTEAVLCENLYAGKTVGH